MTYDGGGLSGLSGLDWVGLGRGVAWRFSVVGPGGRGWRFRGSEVVVVVGVVIVLWLESSALSSGVFI